MRGRERGRERRGKRGERETKRRERGGKREEGERIRNK